MAVFLNLPTGGYTVSVSRANYTNASTDLTINEGNDSKTIYITASFLDIGLYVPRGKYTLVLAKAGYTTITQNREITRKDGE